MPKTNKSQELVSNDILIAEFEYISKTASDANDDRERITNFYNQLFTVSTLAAGFFISNKTTTDILLANNRVEISLVLSALFFSLTFIVLSNLGRLARARAAWQESIEAMNQIKDLYIKRDRSIEPGFKWLYSSIPPKDKPFSIANFLSLEISILGSLTTASSIYFLLYAFNSADTSIGLALVFLGFFIAFIMFWRWYKRLLVNEK